VQIKQQRLHDEQSRSEAMRSVEQRGKAMVTKKKKDHDKLEKRTTDQNLLLCNLIHAFKSWW